MYTNSFYLVKISVYVMDFPLETYLGLAHWSCNDPNCLFLKEAEINHNQGLKNREISDMGGTETIIITDYRSMEKSAKSPIYRRNIGEAPINRRKIASGSDARSNRRRISKYRRYFGIFTDFSENFPIFPTSPARAQNTKSGSKIVDLGFVKFKSNGTTEKRPLKQI